MLRFLYQHVHVLEPLRRSFASLVPSHKQAVV